MTILWERSFSWKQKKELANPLYKGKSDWYFLKQNRGQDNKTAEDGLTGHGLEEPAILCYRLILLTISLSLVWIAISQAETFAGRKKEEK